METKESFGWDVHLVEHDSGECVVLDDQIVLRRFSGETAYMRATSFATDLVMSRVYGTEFRG